MARPSRIRRIAKWSGVVVCVVLATFRVATSERFITYTHRFGGVGVIDGIIWAWTGDLRPALGVGLSILDFSDVWVPRRWPSVGRTSKGHLNAHMPSWMLLVAIALPTVYLFYRDSRHPRGHCQACGYNLKGNVSGVCPECGEVTLPAT